MNRKNDYRNYIHASVDLETLALDDRAVVLSIGVSTVSWLERDKSYILDSEVYLNLMGTVGEQMLLGRTVDPSTVAWWAQSQQATAKERLLKEESFYSLKNAGDTLRQFLKAVSPEKNRLMLWGWGSGFDCNKIESLFPELGVPFWMHRCLRTVADLHGVEVGRTGGTAHHALDDARNQAVVLEQVLTMVDAYQKGEADSA